MEINLNLLPWRLYLYQLNQRKFFAALLALVLTICLGISFHKLFNDELFDWQQKFQNSKHSLATDAKDTRSAEQKKITEFLAILNVVPKTVYLTQITFDVDTISIAGVSENYNGISTLLQLLKHVYLSKIKLISAEQLQQSFDFKINIDL